MAAYIRARKDTIVLANISDEAPSGIRVFLQCMELKKKGPESLDERDCHALAFRGLPKENGGDFR